jgi:hypothetical protein
MLKAAMKIIAPVLAGVLAGALVVGCVWWYGHGRYNAGIAYEQLRAAAAAQKISEQYRAQEAAAQTEAEANYAKYRGQVLAAQAHTADLDHAADGLRRQLADLQTARAAAHPAAGGGTHAAAAPDFIGVIGECAGRYEAVVNYAGRLADQVTGLQGYVAAIQH